MVNNKFITMLGFLMEVFCFVITGYLMAYKSYILATIFLIIALIFAFITGKAIYNSGGQDVTKQLD